MPASAEMPFFVDRRKRAGLVRRIGNVAAKLEGNADPELIAMHMEASAITTSRVKRNHIKKMIASHLEFVGSFTAAEAKLLAQTSNATAELDTLRKFRPDLSDASERVQAAFTDAAAVVRIAMEAK